MNLTQLNPPLPINTPKGTALAHFMIDYGIEHDLHWVCFQDKSGECWTWANPQIRAQKNITQGREYIAPFYNPEDVAFKREEDDENEDEDVENEMYIQDLKDEIERLNKEKQELYCKHDHYSLTIQKLSNSVFMLQEHILELIRSRRIVNNYIVDCTSILISTGMNENDVKTLCGEMINRP